MSHNSIIIDTDSRFSIDPITREIKNLSTSVKNKVIQHDHNSERIGFCMPRFIEGHDMMKCNRVEIHYKNTDASTKEETSGVYEVQDVEIDTTNDEQITFSWLVSQNATQRVGLLCFLVRFACVDENSNIGYAWNSAKFSGICVSEGMYNSDEIVEQYADVLEQWKQDLQSTKSTFVVYPVNFNASGAPLDVNKTTEEMCEAYYKRKTVIFENRPMMVGIDDPIEIYMLMSISSSEAVFGTTVDGTTKTYTIHGQSIIENQMAVNPSLSDIVDEVIQKLPKGDEVYY